MPLPQKKRYTLADALVWEELHVKFQELRERRHQLRNLTDFYKRRLLLDNPGIISNRFKGALEEMKESAREHLKDYCHKKDQNG